MEIKGYITNLGKYNEGYLIGEWVTFPIDEDKQTEIMKRIGCCYEDEDGNRYNTEYEEVFFTDWECDVDFNFGEYESIKHVNEIAETIENFTDYEEKVFTAALEVFSLEEALVVDNFILYEDIETDYDLGYYWVEESGCYDLNSLGNLANYIDYESFGRDIRFESDGGFTDYGWLERC